MISDDPITKAIKDGTGISEAKQTPRLPDVTGNVA